jgi:hypothetical protein
VNECVNMDGKLQTLMCESSRFYLNSCDDRRDQQTTRQQEDETGDGPVEVVLLAPHY